MTEMKQSVKATTVRRQLKCRASLIRRQNNKIQIHNFLRYENEETTNTKERFPWEITGCHHTQYRKNAG